MNAELKVSQLFPPFQRQALVEAAASQDWREIDRITDELVLLGLCRRRSDDSRLPEWAAIRAGGRGIPDGIRIQNNFDETN